jgi:hypothetical protein
MNNAGLISRERIHGELGEIVNGSLPARENDMEEQRQRWEIRWFVHRQLRRTSTGARPAVTT